MVSKSVSKSEIESESENMSNEIQCIEEQSENKQSKLRGNRYELVVVTCSDIENASKYIRSLKYKGIRQVYRIGFETNTKLFITVNVSPFGKRISIEYRYGRDEIMGVPLTLRVNSLEDLENAKEAINVLSEVWNKL